MSWEVALILIFGILIALMATGMPVAFAFMLTCAIGAVLFWGGLVGLDLLAVSFFSSIALFLYLPLPFFILMGCIIFQSGVGIDMVNALDKLLGRLPGRLSVLAIVAGVVLGTMSGVSSASIAILGKTLVPGMSQRGYHKSMSMGPIVGTGLLAILIPPSALAITLGAVGKIDIAGLLVAIIVPGLLMAAFFAAYIIIRCMLNPSLAPAYEVVHIPLKEKIMGFVRYILPVGIVVFATVGVIFMGIAAPTEASALGALACYLLTAIHGRFNWSMVKKSAVETAEVSVMILMILVSAISFSRVLASSGAVIGIVNFATTLSVPPIMVIIITQVIILFLGTALDEGSTIMVTAPMFVPIASALGYDTVWYGVLTLISIELGLITPPLGMAVFVMKGFAPPGVTVQDIYSASTPFLIIGLLLMIMILIYPPIALWLPNLLSNPLT